MKRYIENKFDSKIINQKFIFIFLIQLSLIYSSIGSCGFISISITSNPIYFNQSKKEAIANLTIKNFGNEAAINCNLKIISQYFSTNPITLGNIQPNEEMNVEIRLRKERDIFPGVYHAGILMRYEDANGYKFSLVSPLTIVNEREVYSSAYGILESISIVKEGEIKLKLYNLGNKDKKVNITILFPEELKVENNNIKEYTIPKNGEGELYFKVKNLRGLKESNYFVFAIIDEVIGEERKEHSSFIAGGYIKIAEQISSREYGRDYNFIANIPIIFKISLASLILLLFLFAYFSLKERKRSEIDEN